MKQTNKIQTEINGGVVTFTRVFDAPRSLVWEAWTNPEYLKRWWGPNGFSLTTQEMALIPDGIWRFIMHGPDGTDYPNKVRYVEIVEPEKLVYQHTDDENGTIEFRVTITFLEEGNSTKLIMRHEFGSEEALQRVDKEFAAIEGARQHLTRLAAILKTLSAA